MYVPLRRVLGVAIAWASVVKKLKIAQPPGVVFSLCSQSRAYLKDVPFSAWACSWLQRDPSRFQHGWIV